MTQPEIRFIVHREVWLSLYVDDPLRKTIIETDNFKIAKDTYDKQKRIPNANGLLYEISISIYFDDYDIAYISDDGELRSLDYLNVYDISLDEIREKINYG